MAYDRRNAELRACSFSFGMPVRSGVGGFGGGRFFCWNVSANTAASLQYVLAVVRVSSSAIGPWLVLAGLM